MSQITFAHHHHLDLDLDLQLQLQSRYLPLFQFYKHRWITYVELVTTTTTTSCALAFTGYLLLLLCILTRYRPLRLASFPSRTPRRPLVPIRIQLRVLRDDPEEQRRGFRGEWRRRWEYRLRETQTACVDL